MNIIQDSTPNKTVGRNGKTIDTIVLHSTYGSYSGSVAWLKNPQAQASAHYIISTEGEIRQLVQDKDTAWANGVRTVNERSITIETTDNKEKTIKPKAKEALIWLVAEIKKRYTIKEILFHRDVKATSCPYLDIDKAWFTNSNTDMADYYKGLDLTNKDSMKVAVDEWYNVSQGMYVKAEIVAQKNTMIENLNRELKSCSNLRETDTTTIKTLKDIIKEQEKEIKKLEESLSTRVKEVEDLSLEVSRLNGEVIKAREERNTAVEEAKKEYETTHVKLAKSSWGQVIQRFIIHFESYWNARQSNK